MSILRNSPPSIVSLSLLAPLLTFLAARGVEAPQGLSLRCGSQPATASPPDGTSGLQNFNSKDQMKAFI